MKKCSTRLGPLAFQAHTRHENALEYDTQGFTYYLGALIHDANGVG